MGGEDPNSFSASKNYNRSDSSLKEFAQSVERRMLGSGQGNFRFAEDPY